MKLSGVCRSIVLSIQVAAQVGEQNPLLVSYEAIAKDRNVSIPVLDVCILIMPNSTTSQIYHLQDSAFMVGKLELSINTSSILA